MRSADRTGTSAWSMAAAATRAMAVAAVLGIATPAAMGQSAINGSFPSSWTNVDPGSVLLTNTLNDNAAENHSVQTSGGASGEVITGINGVALNDGDLNIDSFTLQIRSTQTFTLNEAATVAIPTFLFGNINFVSNGVNNSATATVTGSVQVLNNLNAVVLSTTPTATRNANQGNLAVNQFNFASANLAAGAYTVRVTLTATGNADPAGTTALNDGVQALFNSAARDGLAASIFAIPGGLTDSRSAVTAPQARASYNVTGDGVLVGLMETGNPYTTAFGLHTAFAGAGKITLANGAVAGDYQREHAQATAGIIVGADANAANAGVAPGANLLTAAVASYSDQADPDLAALNALIGGGATVINMSASSTTLTATELNQAINANPLVTFVKSSGNNEPSGANSITQPGMAENGIAVGAVNRAFGFRAEFSSFSHNGVPIKPDIVAPGEYINHPVAMDIDNDTNVDDFGRGFLGEGYHRTGSVTGDVTGTSFAAPHVAGAVALLQEYRADHAGTHDATSTDHRVMKVVLMHEADRSVVRHNGNPWAQAKTGSSMTQDLVVTRSLDTELGSGLLNTQQSLSLFAAGEVRQADDNAARNFIIDPGEKRRFWDLENVGGASGGIVGTVDYLIEELPLLRMAATLTWDMPNSNVLAPLELLLFAEGTDDGNLRGFDATAPEVDLLIARTLGVGENVKMLLLDIPNLGPRENEGFYLQVRNTSDVLTTYAIALVVGIPEPGTGLVLLVIGGAACVRRRRAAA